MTGFQALPAAAIADACIRLGVPPRAAPLTPTMPSNLVGRALPVRHAGSVDVFFEALQHSQPGDVLVIDNEGRRDEGCIGDLTALEALHHGVQAIVVDGCHRDSVALGSMRFPVWSLGAFPFGPRAARPRPVDALEAATVCGVRVTAEDLVVADVDGVVFVPREQAVRVWDLAGRIQRVEAEQARLAGAGSPLCEQFQVRQYLEARRGEPGLGFRAHLRRIGKAIEE